jgi:non-canonical purine NTP pyrophosphatase (RdgB/HAM1 family)
MLFYKIFDFVMALYFVTGNAGKFKMVQVLLPDVQQLDIELPEIQSLDAEEVLKHKLQAALQRASGEYIVEDTSVYFGALNWELPGPFIKWFFKALDYAGMANLAMKLGNTDARAVARFGYAKSATEMHYFDADMTGTIVAPRGPNGFGWDPIFQPTGSAKTLGEMTFEEKNAISMRMTALKKLKDFLDSGEPK